MALAEHETPADVTPESSPAPVQEAPAQESPKPAEAGAEIPGPIPYERFKEVNDQLKSLKDSQDWQGYQKLKETLTTDSKFAEHFVNAVKSYYTPPQQAQPQKPDPFAEYPKELADPLRKTGELEQAVQQLMVENQIQKAQAVYGQYINRLNEKMTNIPNHWKDFYREQVEILAGKNDPNALFAYNQNLIDQAFDAVDQRAKSLQRAERGSYVVDKKNDANPVSSNGSAPVSTPKTPASLEERQSLVLELLQAGVA